MGRSPRGELAEVEGRRRRQGAKGGESRRRRRRRERVRRRKEEEQEGKGREQQQQWCQRLEDASEDRPRWRDDRGRRRLLVRSLFSFDFFLAEKKTRDEKK